MNTLTAEQKELLDDVFNKGLHKDEQLSLMLEHKNFEEAFIDIIKKPKDHKSVLVIGRIINKKMLSEKTRNEMAGFALEKWGSEEPAFENCKFQKLSREYIAYLSYYHDFREDTGNVLEKVAGADIYPYSYWVTGNIIKNTGAEISENNGERAVNLAIKGLKRNPCFNFIEKYVFDDNYETFSLLHIIFEKNIANGSNGRLVEEFMNLPKERYIKSRVAAKYVELCSADIEKMQAETQHVKSDLKLCLD